MASQRQRQIIELLQSHKTGLSGNDLSNFLGVSSRTIRTDIKALEGELQAYGAAIHANTRNGYSLEITDEALFAAFIGEAAQGRMDSSPSYGPFFSRPCRMRRSHSSNWPTASMLVCRP